MTDHRGDIMFAEAVGVCQCVVDDGVVVVVLCLGQRALCVALHRVHDVGWSVGS